MGIPKQSVFSFATDARMSMFQAENDHPISRHDHVI